MTIQTLSTPSGDKMVVMSMEDYEDLVDVRRHEAVMLGIKAGTIETFGSAQADKYLAAPSPLAFWREHRGLTASVLADRARLTEIELADIEAGNPAPDLRIYARLAAALGIHAEDLIED